MEFGTHCKSDGSKTVIFITKLPFGTVPLDIHIFYYTISFGTLSGIFSYWLGSHCVSPVSWFSRAYCCRREGSLSLGWDWKVILWIIILKKNNLFHLSQELFLFKSSYYSRIYNIFCLNHVSLFCALLFKHAYYSSGYIVCRWIYDRWLSDLIKWIAYS